MPLSAHLVKAAAVHVGGATQRPALPLMSWTHWKPGSQRSTQDYLRPFQRWCLSAQVGSWFQTFTHLPRCSDQEKSVGQLGVAIQSSGTMFWALAVAKTTAAVKDDLNMYSIQIILQ
jgi:hypothetical protein